MLKASRSATLEDALRKRIIFVLTAAIVGISTIVSINPMGMFDSFLSTSITAAVATAISIIVSVRQRGNGLFGKAHLALSVGLACWLAGQAIWSYETFAAGQEPSESSIADIPWLVLYAFFGYYIFTMYRYFGRVVSKYNIILVSGIVAAVTINTIYNVFLSYESTLAIGPSKDVPGLTTAILRSAYPVLDAVIVVPALLLLITLRRGLLTYTPWLFSSSALVLISGADMLFANMAILGRMDLSTIAYSLYHAGNLAFAGGLYWYNRFVVYDEKRIMEEFRRQNR